MKTNNYIFVLLCLLATTAASAKSDLHYTVAISTDTIRIIKGHVNISLTFDLGERIIYSQHKRIITPLSVLPTVTSSSACQP